MKRPAFIIVVILLLGFTVITPSFGSPNYTTSVTSFGIVATGLSRLHTEGKFIKNEFGRTVFLVGVDFPHFIWAPQIKDRASEQQFEYMRQWEINVVRITISPSYWNQSESYRTKLDDIIGWAENNDIYSALNAHYFGDTTDIMNPEFSWSEWLDFWIKITNRYKGRVSVLYDLMNEPFNISPETHQLKMLEAVDAIRSIDQNVSIIMEEISEESWMDVALNYEQTHPINRTNIIFSQHRFYWNNSRSTTKESIRSLAEQRDWKWCLDNNRPVWTGEVNYDQSLNGTNGQTWFRNYLEVMIEDGYSGFAVWGWMTQAEAGNRDWSLLEDWNGNPSEMGRILQEYLATFSS